MGKMNWDRVRRERHLFRDHDWRYTIDQPAPYRTGVCDPHPSRPEPTALSRPMSAVTVRIGRPADEPGCDRCGAPQSRVLRWPHQGEAVCRDCRGRWELDCDGSDITER